MPEAEAMPDVQPRRVRVEFRDNLAVLRIDNPPVNVGSHDVRQALIEALDAAKGKNVEGAVLIGAGKCFIAGSDLREFDLPLAFPELPDVIGAIENAPFPVVAAIHGVALGGGLELALGCDYRIAARGTRLGLPETSLGFVPGAGGTQRLPRLIGRRRAITMICAVERIDAEEALSLGLIDHLCEGDLLKGALHFLLECPRPKRLSLELPVPEEPAAAIEEAAARALRRGKERPNLEEAIELVRGAGTGPARDWLDLERAAFHRLRVASDAVALRYLFFAERRAASGGTSVPPAQPLNRIGIVGGGTMGQGIARSALSSGFDVVLVERLDDQRQRCQQAIHDHWLRQVEIGKLRPEFADARLAALTVTGATVELKGCDLVIEAVFEDMQAKREVLVDIEAVVPPDVVVATNTSYLDIDEMVSALAHPERVLGLHFFSPADVMSLLEIVPAAATSDETVATGLLLARRLGKQPVIARVSEGFIGNRIYAAYRRRAELLVLDGSTPQEVDAAMRAYGFAMGPFEVADLSGLDIAWAMRKRQAATRDPAARYVTIPDRLCEAGRLGRKTGAGWYDYSQGAALPDLAVSEIIEAARTDAGITQRSFTPDEITRQLLATIVNEGSCVIAEGMAREASDIDVVWANGYGFPRWRGGPLYWAKQLDRSSLRADLSELSAAVGHGFRRGPVEDVLSALAIGQADAPVQE